MMKMTALIVAEIGSARDKNATDYYAKLINATFKILSRINKKVSPVVTVHYAVSGSYLPPDHDFYILHGEDPMYAGLRLPPEKLKCCIYVSSPHAQAINTGIQRAHWAGDKIKLGTGKLTMRYPPDHFSFDSLNLSQLDESLVKSVMIQRNSRKQLFHISLDGTLEGQWKPQQPTSLYTQDDRKKLAEDIEKEKNQTEEERLILSPYTETLEARICFSDNIQGCFSGVYPTGSIVKMFSDNVSRFIHFFLYYPKDYKDKDLMTPEDLTRARQVWDAHVTNEYCLFSAVMMVQYPLVLRVHKKVELGAIVTRPYGSEGDIEYHSPLIKYDWVKIGAKS